MAQPSGDSRFTNPWDGKKAVDGQDARKTTAENREILIEQAVDRPPPSPGHLSPPVQHAISPGSNEEKASISKVSVNSVRFSAQSSQDGRTLTPKREKRFRTVSEKEVHWVSRRVMVGSFVLAVAGFVSHHGFYASYQDRSIGDKFDQQRTRL
jgi:type II secretory pathway component PulL